MPFNKLSEMNILYMDFETTGLEPRKDRIVEIACILEKKSGEREEWQTLVHPEMPIPAEVTKIHGIKDSDVAHSPKMRDLLAKMAAMLEECDVIAGYNVIFDVKMLMAEAIRNEVILEVHDKKIWDMQKIYFHHEPRNLSAAYRFYCQKELEGAHRAINDVQATIDIFKAQQKKYEMDLTEKSILDVLEVPLPLDSNGAFIFNSDQDIELSFGKHKGKVVSCTNNEIKNYLSWMTNAGFPEDTKKIARALLKGRHITRENLTAILQE